MKVTHLIADMNKGGCQMVLYQVMKFKTRKDITYQLITLGLGSYYEEELRELGYEVIELDIKHHPVQTMCGIIRALKGTDVLFCWMYHSNLIGFVCGKLARVPRIIWGVHHSDLSRKLNSSKTLMINRICAVLSRAVTTVTYSGKAARRVHEAIGYDRRKSVVLENGIDLSLYRYNEEARREIREEFDIPDDKTVILSVARFWPIKDVPTFVRAFSRVHKKYTNTVALMCGLQIEESNTELMDLCQRYGLSVGKDVMFAGFRTDIEKFLSAADLYVLHSASEAFPMTLLQAMSSECLLVSTNVGDVKAILANKKLIAPPQCPEKLADRMEYVLGMRMEEKDAMRKQNLSRVSARYDIHSVVKRYERVIVDAYRGHK